MENILENVSGQNVWSLIFSCQSVSGHYPEQTQCQNDNVTQFDCKIVGTEVLTAVDVDQCRSVIDFQTYPTDFNKKEEIYITKKDMN